MRDAAEVLTRIVYAVIVFGFVFGWIPEAVWLSRGLTERDAPNQEVNHADQ